jgi:hypothetical protein
VSDGLNDGIKLAPSTIFVFLPKDIFYVFTPKKYCRFPTEYGQLMQHLFSNMKLVFASLSWQQLFRFQIGGGFFYNPLSEYISRTNHFGIALRFL